jgi:catechol 2,3-dioxygenase-like lactoylglutathione lyase family enzyme
MSRCPDVAADAAGTSRPPALCGAIAFVYYDDLAAAVAWYARLGLVRVWDGDWVVVFEAAPGQRVGLVDGARGLLRPLPGPDKGVLLSFETDDLAGWHAWFREHAPEELGSPVRVGTDGQTQSFVVRDPGGYTVEFFRWVKESA